VDPPLAYSAPWAPNSTEENQKKTQGDGKGIRKELKRIREVRKREESKGMEGSG